MKDIILGSTGFSFLTACSLRKTVETLFRNYGLFKNFSAEQIEYSRRESVMFTRRLMGLSLPLLILTLTLTTPMSAQAQISFSEKTAELEQLEVSVNDCAARQLISSCLGALSRTQILQISHVDSENSADRIMRNAVMLLPLYMLTELYNRRGHQDVSCGYALSGERHLNRLLKDIDSLISKDPAAFRNIGKTKRELQDLGAGFDKVLAQCG